MILSFLLLSSLANAGDPTVVIDPAIIESLSFDVGARQAVLPEGFHICGIFGIQKVSIGQGSSLLCTDGGVGVICTTVNPAETYWGGDSWSPKYPTVAVTKGGGTVQERLTTQKKRLEACFTYGMTPSDAVLIDPDRVIELSMPSSK